MDLESQRAIAAYGECYDLRTDTLATSLARTGKGPTKAARAEFAAFEADLRDFESKALSDTQKSAGNSQRTSYADLYEKQFRYEFYEEYESKLTRSARPLLPLQRNPRRRAQNPLRDPCKRPRRHGVWPVRTPRLTSQRPPKNGRVATPTQ